MINHLAIIMDWNRRWAKKKMLPAIVWHKYWADNVKKITKICSEKWINYLTLWALSTDNLQKRNEEEVENIIKLINWMEKYLWEMLKEDVKLNIIGDIKRLPDKSQEVLKNLLEKTKNNKKITLTIALVYWWQDEIIRWIKNFIKAWWDINSLDKNNFKQFLDTRDLPNPDVIVRTGWDIRHSWFLLYDSEYSEYYFTKKYWPAFDEEELDKVIDFYKNCKRNFWK